MELMCDFDASMKDDSSSPSSSAESCSGSLRRRLLLRRDLRFCVAESAFGLLFGLAVCLEVDFGKSSVEFASREVLPERRGSGADGGETAEVEAVGWGSGDDSTWKSCIFTPSDFRAASRDARGGGIAQESSIAQISVERNRKSSLNKLSRVGTFHRFRKVPRISLLRSRHIRRAPRWEEMVDRFQREMISSRRSAAR